MKKAGIVAAAGAASLVAVSPLAFAGEEYEANDSFNKTKDSHNKTVEKNDVHVGHEGGNVADKSAHGGLVNISGNNVNTSPTTCFTAANGNSVVQGALGGLFSEAENSSGVTSDNSVQCTNASDAGDEFNQSNDGGSHQDGEKGTK
nr:hypothetical protein [Pseudonocardia sp. C8]